MDVDPAIQWREAFFTEPESADGRPAFDVWERLDPWVRTVWPHAQRSSFWLGRRGCGLLEPTVRPARLSFTAFASLLRVPRFGLRLYFVAPLASAAEFVRLSRATVYSSRSGRPHTSLPSPFVVGPGQLVWEFGMGEFCARFGAAGGGTDDLPES